MKIGDKMTDPEFYEFKKQFSNSRFGADYYILDDDLKFEKKVDSDIIYWELVSTFKSRVAEQGDGPKIHRPESKSFKSYYDKRKI